MICTCLSECSFNDCMQVVAYCEMAEIRLDSIKLDNIQIDRLFSRPDIPLIAAFRATGTDDNYRFEVLQAAILAGVAYVDVEKDAPYAGALIRIAKEKQCKVIISHHQYTHTPEHWELQDLLEQMRGFCPDYFKIVTYARQPLEAMRVLGLYETEKKLLAFAMGPHGRFSRIAAYALGAPFIYAAPDHGTMTAEGQYTVSQLQTILQAMNMA